MVTTISILVGEMLTGRITATVDATGGSWRATLNDSGAVEGVTVTDDVIRSLDLRSITHGGRSFIAWERDERIKQGGPIWSRPYDWEKGVVSLGGQGMWSYLDHLFVRPSILPTPIQAGTVTLSGKSLGGIARGLVSQVLSDPRSAVPIVLPADEAGDHTETFPLWKLLKPGEQLREITKRAVDAPDIRFQPRRRADDPRFIEWVMEVGTEPFPELSQGGPDWVFDTTAPENSVIAVVPDEDATGMAEQVWLTGNGQEENILMSLDSDPTLLNLGWPLMEASDSFSAVEEQATLDGHAANFLARSARPVESVKLVVRAAAAAEIQPGDYCRLITKKDGPVKGSAWIGDMDQTMRVRQMSGDHSDQVTLEMFSVQASL